MDKKKVFDIFNYKKSSSSKNTPVDVAINVSIHADNNGSNTNTMVNINHQLEQDISINTTDSKANTATLESDLDLGNWDSGPVRPILKVRLYIYYF